MAKAGMRRPDKSTGTEKIKQSKLRNEDAQVGENKQKTEPVKSDTKDCFR